MGASLLLTPGFRFHPTDDELVNCYLKKKVSGRKFPNRAIAEIDIYKYAPWDLPDKSFLKSRDLEWYFFCPIEKKYACGARRNRATGCGYWKTTGKDRPVTSNGKVAGMIKTLVFHTGRAPKGDRTDWVMHEYRLEDKNLNDIKDLYVLCKIFHKAGPGPRNGAQYGAPFKEEEWTDDDEESHVEQVGPSEPNSLVASSSKIPQRNPIGSYCESCLTVIPLQPVSSTDVGLNNSAAPMIGAIGSLSESYISDVFDPSCNLPQPVPHNDVVGVEKLPHPDDDDLLSLLYKSVDGGPFTENENVENKVVNNVNQHDPLVSHFDGTNLFEGLDDLGIWNGLCVDGIGISNAYNTGPDFDGMFSGEDGFLELSDLGAQPGFDCNNANLGSSSYQVNAVDEVQSYSALPGGAFGLEDHQFDPCTSAQNHSHSMQPEVVSQCLNPDTVSGSQNLWNTK